MYLLNGPCSHFHPLYQKFEDWLKMETVALGVDGCGCRSVSMFLRELTEQCNNMQSIIFWHIYKQ